MQRKLFVMFMVLSLIFTTVVIAGAAEPEFELRFCTAGVPNDAHTQALYNIKKEIETMTNGEITLTIHHSGQLFSQEAAHSAIMRGSLAMCYLGPNWVADYLPKMSMFSAGYTFQDYDHMSNVMNSEIGRGLFDDIANEIGVRPLGAYYLGTRQLNLRDIGHKVMTPADMEGVKLRMPNSQAWLFLGKVLGANPTPISFTELYMALKTGTVDGQDNPLPTDKNAKFYEVTDQIILTDHQVGMVLPCINEDIWQKLSAEQQEKMYQAVEEGRKVCDKLNLEREAELVEFFRGEGLEVYEPNKDAFIERAEEMYWNSEFSESWDRDLYDKIQEMAD